MKKSLFLILFMFSFLFSCTNKEEKSAKSADEKIVLKVAGWNLAAKALNAAAIEYEKENPNVKIEIIESDSTYKKIIPTFVSGQGAPDVILVQTKDLNSISQKFPGQFYDLTDLMKKDGLDKNFVKTEIFSATVDNKIVGIPWEIGPAGIFYRKDMFEKAGIKAEEIETWDDFINASKKLQSALPGVTMLANQDKSIASFEILFRQLGGSYIKDGKLTLDSPEAVRAFELLTKMKKANILLNIGDWNGRIVATNNDKIAAIMLPVWYSGTIKTTAENQKGKWSVMELPAYEKGGNRRSSLGGSSLTISSQTKYPEEAYKFIKRITSELKGLEVTKEYGLFSAYTPFYEKAEFKGVDEYFGIDINDFFSKLTDGIPRFQHGVVTLEGASILNSMNEAVLNGKDIKKALKDTSEEISQKLKVEINK